jgi:hypothetical protein
MRYPSKRILSLGAGVQSSTVALMAERGVIEKIDCAIFADTQAEPKKVYDWLEYLKTQLSYPVHVVTAGNLGEETIKIYTKANGDRYINAMIPAFMYHPDENRPGLLSRKCTHQFKIEPVQQKIRLLKNFRRASKRIPITDMLIGISTDEAHRMREANVIFLRNVYPLIDLDMTRTDCLVWMKENGYPEPPRSSCLFCPFHGGDEWLSLTKEDFARAVKLEKDLQESVRNQGSLKGVPYLHSSCKPLDTVEFKNTPDHNTFGNECEGMCGV